MDKNGLLREIRALYEECPGNTVSEAQALCPEVMGEKLFEAPLLGIGSAEDALFTEYKKAEVVGPWFLTPTEWMESARTVVSLFFPFTEAVKKSNWTYTDGPSPLWLHGRIEGQEYLNGYMRRLKDRLEALGLEACVPGLDARFVKIVAGRNFTGYAGISEKTFGSNWSERHAAYVCGLGTFGLSKGLITNKGMAGRFVSVLISEELPADPRPYQGIYDNCIRCGACVRRCPVDAISLEKGKDHVLCGAWLDKMGEIHAPRYGCGLCQTKVPCGSRNPSGVRFAE